MTDYIQQPNPAGYYYKPERLNEIDVYVSDDFERKVRYIVLSMKNADGDHDQQVLLVEKRADSSPARTWLLWREDPQGTGNGYIEPSLFAYPEFQKQLTRFVAHCYSIPPFPSE